MQWLYACDMQKKLEFALRDFKGEGIKKEREQDYANRLLQAFTSHRSSIDELLDELSHSWPTQRMGKVDLALLRLATTEILYLEDIPTEVSITEAMELSKQFSTEDSAAFINGLLGSVAETMDEQA